MKKFLAVPTTLLTLLFMAACGGGASAPGGGGDPGGNVTSITSVSIAPASPTVIAGQTQQFTATVTGTGNFSHAVRWNVNDIAGGSATTGTIADGLYTAPGQVPDPSTVTVKAVSTVDASKSASAQVTIAAPPAAAAPTIVWPETNLSVSGDDGEASETPPGLAVVDDGSDGAFVLWEHRYPIGIWAQHLNANGEPIWPAGGVPVTSTWTGWQAAPRAVADGNGGVIVVWIDARAGWCDLSLQAECDVYGQRLDSSGNLLWGDVGKPITTAPGNQGIMELMAVADDVGGAFIAYSDGRTRGGGVTLYVQRVNGSGDPVWTGDGIRIGQDPEADEGGDIGHVKLLGDGSGGVLAAWYFISYATSPATKSVRVQRISELGQVQWSSGGVPVPGVSATDPNGNGIETLDLVSDGAGGLIMAAASGEVGPPLIAAQRVDAMGNIRWSTTGVHVPSSTLIAMNPSATSDGQGGAYISWQDCPSYAECDISVARVNGSGELMWGPKFGVQLPNQQLAPVVVPNNSGGALVMWTDCRAYASDNDCYFNSDIYAQSFSATGSALYDLNGAPLSASPGNQGQQYAVFTPWPAMAWTRLSSGDIVIAWPDGRNGDCFATTGNSVCQVYVERFKP